jgi:hypothetical protein
MLETIRQHVTTIRIRAPLTAGAGRFLFLAQVKVKGIAVEHHDRHPGHAHFRAAPLKIVKFLVTEITRRNGVM